MINLLIQIQIHSNTNCTFPFEAPSAVPKIQIKKTWWSDIEVSWDEIPLQQRNGFIKSYQVFYWEENGSVKGWLKGLNCFECKMMLTFFNLGHFSS